MSVQEVLPPKTEVAAYTPLLAQLVAFKKENAKLVFDYANPKGNAAARSHVYEMRKAKGEIERVRVKQKEESLAFGRKVDAEAKLLTTEIDEMIQVHQVDLDKIKEAEDARKAAIAAKLEFIRSAGQVTIDDTSVTIAKRIEELGKMDPQTFAEFAADATTRRDTSLRQMEAHLLTVRQREQEAIELAQRRAADAARAEEERIAAEKAAAEARVAAEALAAKEAAKQAAAAAAREAELKSRADQEAAARKAADEAAAAARVAQAAAEATAAAERRKAEAAAAERAKQAEAEASQRAADERRAASIAHQKKIHAEIMGAMIKEGVIADEDAGRLLIIAIREGRVPHMKVEY